MKGSGAEVERFSEGGQLLLAQFDLVVDLALVDDQFGFHGDEVAVVGELVVGEVFGQEVGHLAAAPVDVLLETLGLLQLLDQLVAFAFQHALHPPEQQLEISQSINQYINQYINTSSNQL